MGKSLARGKISILEQLLKNQQRRSQAAKIIGRLIRNEMRHICSDKRMSILRETSEAAMKGFRWETVWLELQLVMPLLMTILEHSFPEKLRTEKLRPLLCLCASMLLKRRQPKMCHVQAAISLHVCYKLAIVGNRYLGLYTLHEVSVLSSSKYLSCRCSTGSINLAYAFLHLQL